MNDSVKGGAVLTAALRKEEVRGRGRGRIIGVKDRDQRGIIRVTAKIIELRWYKYRGMMPTVGEGELVRERR